MTALIGLAIALTLSLSGCNQSTQSSTANSYPTHAINFILPLPAGSAPDTTFRKASALAATKLGQRIDISDVPGGSAQIGLERIAAAKPDGYTLGAAFAGATALVPQLTHSAFKGPGDLQVIAQVDIAPLVIVVKTGSGIGSLQDLIRKAKAQPRKVKFGEAATHDLLAADVALIEKHAKVTFDKVAFGAGKQALAVLNGSADAAIIQPVVVKQYIMQGKLTPLALISPQPLPDIKAPLLSSQGYTELVNPYEFVAAPKGLPSAEAEKVQAAYAYAVRSPQFVDYAKKSDLIAAYEPGRTVQPKLLNDVGKFQNIIRDLGWSS